MLYFKVHILQSVKGRHYKPKFDQNGFIGKCSRIQCMEGQTEQTGFSDKNVFTTAGHTFIQSREQKKMRSNIKWTGLEKPSINQHR
jgi:hypothetical protein